MAPRAPGVHRSGTAKEAADVGIGYTASGASEHTRQSAHGNVKMRGYVEGNAPVWARTEPEQLGSKIAKQARLLAALHMKLRFETDEWNRQKIAKNILIKTRFLESLKASRR